MHRSVLFVALMLIPISYAGAQIPQIERDALIALYNNTDGANWFQNDGWLGPVGSECSWTRVVCLDGHVNYLPMMSNQLRGSLPPELGNLSMIYKLNFEDNFLSGNIPSELGQLSWLSQLSLGNNHLSGSIPAELGNLSQLRWFWLRRNKLSGEIPPEIGNLTDLVETSIGYNAIWTDDPTLLAFLDTKDRDWDEAQTIAPAGITVVSVADRTIWLEWTPILYTADSGGYEVLAEDVTRALVSGGYTLNKLASTFPVTALQPDQTYDLTVATFTRPHSKNRNTVVSDPTDQVMATTSNTGCATPVITISGGSVPYTLTVTSTHDTFEWVTGETTSSITVNPHGERWYWVNTTGPGSCEEAAVALTPVLFYDGFESGDLGTWSDVGD